MWFSRLRTALRRLLASGRAERELHDEIQAYAGQLADEHRATGMTPVEARRRALIEVGGTESVKESVRDSRTGVQIEQWWQDVRYALRGLRRGPSFTITVVLMLGLGIGVNTTIFSVINAALLTPLPYERPEELVSLMHRTNPGTPQESLTDDLSWPEIHLWRAEARLFQGVEATDYHAQPLTWRERNEPLNVASFTAGLPGLLGIVPQAGRLFTAGEAAQRVPVVVLSDGLWSRAFGRSAGAIGSTMTIEGTPMTIVGVMPREFRFGPGGGGRFDVWTALADGGGASRPGANEAKLVARLRAGLSLDSARNIAAEIASGLRAGGAAGAPWIPEISSMGHMRAQNLQTPLWLLLAATGLVLVVASANVANLLSARSIGRRHELAMRAALGASRVRLARLLFVEGTLIAGLAGASAVLFAALTAQTLVVLIPARMMLMSGLFDVSLPGLDWRVLAFALSVTVLVTLMSVLWPAIRASMSAVGEGNRIAGAPAGSRRMSAWLQAVQVALALLLATVAGLFATSLIKIATTDVGFDANGLVSLDVRLPATRFPAAESQRQAFAEVLSLVRTTPGVRSAAIGNRPPSPFIGSTSRPGSTASTRLSVRFAGSDYFSTAGIRLVAGRAFGPQDTSATQRVAIIDEVAARLLFPGQSPLGQQFSAGRFYSQMTIVGVVGAVATGGFTSRPDPPGVYFAQEQEASRWGTVLIRLDRDAPAVLRSLQFALAGFEPDMEITEGGPVAAHYDQMETYSTPRFYVALVVIFAAMAVMTAAVGLYGLLSYSVGQRQREIGVRVALGSTAGQIRSFVLVEALRPVLAGLIVGTVMAWISTGLLAAFLYEVSPQDPGSFAAGAAMLLVAALLATIGPIRRATGVDPIQALRAE